MTQPAPSPPLTTDEQLSGRAVEAVADMHNQLRRRYSGLNTAEAQLAEALLTAQAASEAGRMRLQDIQRQLVEAINNPVNALDTPAGERQFLLFLRGKIAEIQRIIDDGALTAHDQAELTRAFGSVYLAGPLVDDPQPMPDAMPTSLAPRPIQALPASSMASLPTMGGLPQAAMPSASPTSGLGAAASPLAGLASLLAGQQHDEPMADEPHTTSDEPEDRTVTSAEDDEQEPADDDAPPDDTGPAETRPAAS
jgi:Domain of unknown function (DUF4226)